MVQLIVESRLRRAIRDPGLVCLQPKRHGAEIPRNWGETSPTNVNLNGNDKVVLQRDGSSSYTAQLGGSFACAAALAERLRCRMGPVLNA